jgi:hypothetical protein
MESNKNLLFNGKRGNYINYFELSIIILLVINAIAIILESNVKLSQENIFLSVLTILQDK